MKSNQSLAFNFFTKSYDIPGEYDSDEKARQYIPQDGASQNIYSIYRSMGRDIPHAMLEVLLRHTTFRPNQGVGLEDAREV